MTTVAENGVRTPSSIGSQKSSQWYATGAIEVIGGALFLFPRTCAIGAALLACTMVGAMLVHIVVRHSVAGSLFPALVLVAVVAIAARGRD